MKAKLSVAASIIVGGVLLWAAFHGVPLAEVVTSVKAFEPQWTPLLILLPVVDLFVRAARWRILLRPLAETKTQNLFQLEAVGLALNNILFMRLGELARAILCGLELKVHAFAVLATIVVERLCDIGALLGLFTMATWLAGVPVDPALRLSAGVGALLVVLALFVAALSEKWLARLARESLSGWPRIAHLAEDLAAGTRGLHASGAWLSVGVLSLALWAIDALVFWVTARALDLEPLLSYGQAVVVVTTAAAATSLPGAPGGFGNFEAAVKWVLVRFGAAPGEAFAYAAFTHLTMYAVVTIIGIICLYRLGHSIEGLKQAVSRLSQARRAKPHLSERP